jgi:hypothetical protein
MSRLTAIALAASLLSGPAFAGCGAIKLPPIELDHALLGPDPVIHFMDYWAIDGFCRSMGVTTDGRGRVEACNLRREMWLPTLGTGGITLEQQRCMFRHERGHMTGWAWNHPGAHYE